MLNLLVEPSAEVSKNLEVISQIEPIVAEAVNTMLLDINDCWQPTDFLPDMQQENALDMVKQLRERAAGIPDEVLVSLVGNMITEEALPSYQTFFNLLKGVNEERNVASQNPWACWSRKWTAEENRHGDLLNKYLYLTGRVDMRAVERSIHKLIAEGFDPQTAANTGLELVTSIAQYDLRGTVRYLNRPKGGGRFVLNFPILNAADCENTAWMAMPDADLDDRSDGQ